MRKVGDKRTFSNDNRIYNIEEIIDNPSGITLEWKWVDSVCPHCKKRLERKMTHQFYRIEILRDNIKEDIKSLKKEDVIMLGSTLDGRTMILPLDKYSEICKMSEKFKNLGD